MSEGFGQREEDATHHSGALRAVAEIASGVDFHDIVCYHDGAACRVNAPHHQCGQSAWNGSTSPALAGGRKGPKGPSKYAGAMLLSTLLMVMQRECGSTFGGGCIAGGANCTLMPSGMSQEYEQTMLFVKYPVNRGSGLAESESKCEADISDRASDRSVP